MTPTALRIPFVDLSPQAGIVAQVARDEWPEIIRRGQFVGGLTVAAFETAWAAYCGARHCVGVANGTDAIELAVRALGLHHVTVPANTFVATIEGIYRGGATPQLVDPDPDTLLAPECDLPVNLYGQIAQGGRVNDAAQSHGATRHGQRLTGADATTFSFYPSKNLGAPGDAGAIVTDDPDLAKRIRVTADHGNRGEHPGQNSRLDALHAAALRAKLDHLDTWNAQRQAAAAYYDELLGSCEQIRLPETAPGNTHVWHLYVVRVPRRDIVLAHLRSDAITAQVHYPTPIHKLPAYTDLDRRGGYPPAERAAGEILSLPMWPGITEAQQERVAESLTRALR